MWDFGKLKEVLLERHPHFSLVTLESLKKFCPWHLLFSLVLLKILKKFLPTCYGLVFFKSSKNFLPNILHFSPVLLQRTSSLGSSHLGKLKEISLERHPHFSSINWKAQRNFGPDNLLFSSVLLKIPKKFLSTSSFYFFGSRSSHLPFEHY